MAKTPTEKINELLIEVRVLDERLENSRTDIKNFDDRLAKLKEASQAAQLELAVLRHAVDELRKSKELWSSRWWTIVAVVIGCLLTCVLSLVVALLRKQPG